MNADRLRQELRRLPFVPFVIHMADGRAIPVKHPDFMYITPPGRTAFVSTKGELGEWLDVMLITSIEQTDGQRRRRARRRAS